ncbi:PREDICTED: putative nuclease HARBI1 isoform X2 [Nicrophorus vespilloides]|uniref:Nuclease HARBI1 isoform X2 n=1 Tax=Nicrophorus vespilloides TaxID=110193 RepID=A0ABM1M0U8_NICVS|nr:PREDICTED: putative nuclease HARBI1 isoform X2 [Nicrophorus vespilloides]
MLKTMGDYDDLDEEVYDEEEELYHMYFRQPNTIKPRMDNLENWSDAEFYEKFRFTKHTVVGLLEQIKNKLIHKTNKNNPVTPVQQLLITLGFFASGSFYITIGDFAGIHKTTTGKIIHRVCDAISSLLDQYVYMPSNTILDCTHVKIQSPGGEDADYYRCRNGYFAINVQAMCNASLKFVDIVARWPGSTHASTIFENSFVKSRFENKEFKDGLVLGGGCFPLRNYLITPIRNPQTEGEHRFNESHMKTRRIMEKCLRLWKKRFPILTTGMRCKVPLVQKIIVTTAILHNISIDCNETEPDVDGSSGEENDILFNCNEVVHQDARNDLIKYFSNSTN